MREVDAHVGAIVGLNSISRPIHQQRWWSRRWIIILIASLIACLIIFLRRPDALLNPQFFAEDGAYYYAQAYNLGGLRALLLPAAGYLLLSARLVALIAMYFPLSWGPAIFDACATLAQAAPVSFLFTRRFDRLIPNWYARGAIALLYLAAPNSYRLDGSLTYAQWHLALLATLVVIAAPSSGRAWKVFDGAIILLSGLSGPYCFSLAPVILLRWLRTHNRQHLTLLVINLFATAVQGVTLLANMTAQRGSESLGASGVALARIVAGQFFLAAVFGGKGYAVISTTSWWASTWFPILVSLSIVSFIAFILSRAPQELQLLWLFAVLVFGSALIAPIGAGDNYWQQLAHPLWNLRYVFLLIVAWLATLIWLLTRTPGIPPAARRVALVLLTLTCMIGIPLDWQHPAFTDNHYEAYVQQFDRMPPGSRIEIPLNPDPYWTMTLIKH